MEKDKFGVKNKRFLPLAYEILIQELSTTAKSQHHRTQRAIQFAKERDIKALDGAKLLKELTKEHLSTKNEILQAEHDILQASLQENLPNQSARKAYVKNLEAEKGLPQKRNELLALENEIAKGAERLKEEKADRIREGETSEETKEVVKDYSFKKGAKIGAAVGLFVGLIFLGPAGIPMGMLLGAGIGGSSNVLRPFAEKVEPVFRAIAEARKVRKLRKQEQRRIMAMQAKEQELNTKIDTLKKEVTNHIKVTKAQQQKAAMVTKITDASMGRSVDENVKTQKAKVNQELLKQLSTVKKTKNATGIQKRQITSTWQLQKPKKNSSVRM